jgi:hypothetical protein
VRFPHRDSWRTRSTVFCALPDIPMKCTAFIFRILTTKSVTSFQMSGRNIANIRCSNPKDLVPHYENMFAPNKIVKFCINSSGWCTKGHAWRRYGEAYISGKSSRTLLLSTKMARSLAVAITALFLWEGHKLCERDPVNNKPHCLLSHTHTHTHTLIKQREGVAAFPHT